MRHKRPKEKKRSCCCSLSLQSNNRATPSAYLPQGRSKMPRHMRQNLLCINQSRLRLKSNQRKRRVGLDSLARKGLTRIRARKKKKRGIRRRSADSRKSGQERKKK